MTHHADTIRVGDVEATVALPAEAVQLLYDVLGHFPHERGSWSNVARERCSVALAAAREPAPDPEPEGISNEQIGAFHAMTTALDRKHGLPVGTFKQRIKAVRGVESVKDFTHAEAHEVLDLIAIDLDAPE